MLRNFPPPTRRRQNIESQQFVNFTYHGSLPDFNLLLNPGRFSTSRPLQRLELDQRQRRIFGKGFKQNKEQEIEQAISSVGQICKEYKVSYASVYRCLIQYGLQSYNQ